MRVINTYFVISSPNFFGDIKRVFELANGDYILESHPMDCIVYEKISKERFEKLQSNWNKK